MNLNECTKVEAVVRIFSKLKRSELSWTEIYQGIQADFPHFTTAKDWKAGVRGVVYREIRNKRTFTRKGEGVIALKA